MLDGLFELISGTLNFFYANVSRTTQSRSPC